MSISFDLHLIPDSLDNVVRRARLAEQSGFQRVWIAETHLSARDLYIAMTLCALNTSRVMIGSGVTNIITRDNTLTASTAGTLDEVSGGRVILGIGSGDTPIYMLGKRMSSLASLRQAVVQIRSLLRGETIDYNGVQVTLPWCKRNVPIYLSAEGPRTMELAAEIADGVIVGSGVYEDTVSWALGQLRKGMAARSSSLGELDIVFGAMCSVDRDGHAAREKVRSRVANRAHHNFLKTLESVPATHQTEVRHLMEHFDVREWSSPKHTPLITDYLLDRFAITGTPAQCIERLRKLESCGVKRVMIDPPSRDFEASLEMFAREVLPFS